ncbi:AMP-binding protein [Actinomadura nitritigenes]|uniref:AMP-binding protein n=1 Tax=Actinomadura nitritigenes TaxID=134602 RepID=UPI003D89C5BB
MGIKDAKEGPDHGTSDPVPPRRPGGLVGRIAEHAARAPSRVAVMEAGASGGLTYAELDAAAAGRAAWLSGHGSPGDRVLLVYSAGSELLKSLLGCLYAGMTAVAAPVPGPPWHRAGATGRALDAEPRVVLTDIRDLMPVADWMGQDGLPRMSLLTTDVADLDVPSGPGAPPPVRPPAPDSVALLRYVPRPGAGTERLTYTHDEVARQLELACRAMGLAEGVRSGAWLPQLPGVRDLKQVLATLYAGGTAITLPPGEPLPPRRWLELIDRHRIEVTGAPARFYDEGARGVPAESVERLDLSHWRRALIEADQAAEGAPARFAARFARAGFRPEAFTACYSPASWTTLVSTSPAITDAGVRSLERGVLEPLRSCPLGTEVAAPADPGAVPLVGLEVPPDVPVGVVDPGTGEAIPDLRIGEIEMAGADGRGRERTGDLGVRHGNRVYLVGRSDETLSAYGRTVYPGFVERWVRGLHRAFEGGMGGVFTVPALHEELVVAHEIRQDGDEEFCLTSLAWTIRDALARRSGVRAGNVVLLRAGEAPRNAEGGINRALLRDLFMADALESLHEELDQEVRRRYRREPSIHPVRLVRSRPRRPAGSAT